MLYVILGDNSYRAEQEITSISGSFDGEIVSVTGEDMTADRLADYLAGNTLFSADQLIIIRNLSKNTVLWPNLESWFPRIADSRTVVLVERTLDKRTKTYKALKKTATVIEAPHWTEREYRDAEAWVDKIAHSMKVVIGSQLIANMVRRAMHSDDSGKIYIDQTELLHALSSMKGSKQATADIVDTLMPPDVQENTFELLTVALERKKSRLATMISHLKATEDPYRTFGLLANQWFQLVSLSITDKPSGEVAQALGVHTYPLQKMASYRKRFDRKTLSRLTALMAQLDHDTKTTTTDPWYAVERFLLETVSIDD